MKSPITKFAAAAVIIIAVLIGIQQFGGSSSIAFADVLEQIRLLSNLETETDKLLQIMLIGQPELDDVLALHELRQLAQRITARYHLQELDKDETVQYIAHRLRKAGGRDKVKFTVMFRGRDAIHRVAPVEGTATRMLAVLAYNAEPGVSLSESARMTFFGRLG